MKMSVQSTTTYDTRLKSNNLRAADQMTSRQAFLLGLKLHLLRTIENVCEVDHLVRVETIGRVTSGNKLRIFHIYYTHCSLQPFKFCTVQFIWIWFKVSSSLSSMSNDRARMRSKSQSGQKVNEYACQHLPHEMSLQISHTCHLSNMKNKNSDAHSGLNCSDADSG